MLQVRESCSGLSIQERTTSLEQSSSRETEVVILDYSAKVCRAQWLGSYSQGQGHGHVKGQIVPKILLLINY